LELLAPVSLNVVCFRYTEPDLEEAELDRINREILLGLPEDGIAIPSSTLREGRFALRVAITNHRTRRSDIDLLIDSVLALGRRLGKAGDDPAVPAKETVNARDMGGTRET